MLVGVLLEVGMPPKRVRLWKTFELPAVPRVGEKFEPLNGWGMAVVADVQWSLLSGEVDVVARYPSSAEEMEKLIAGGWRVTGTEFP